MLLIYILKNKEKLMSKVTVLGGGLSGRLMAFQLAEQGISVELFEKGERDGAQAAAYVAAAMLAPSAEAVEATPEVIRLGKQSIALWRAIVGRLNTPVMMQENGSLMSGIRRTSRFPPSLPVI